MKNGRLQAKDIPDADFLAAVEATYAPWGVSTPWAIADYLSVPEKVVLAKARRLINRGVMEGCPCGCRGDFRVLQPSPST